MSQSENKSHRPGSRRSASSSSFRYALVAVLAVVGIALSFAGFYTTKNWEKERSRYWLEELTGNYTSPIVNKISNSIKLLDSIAALFDAISGVNRNDFGRFASSLLEDTSGIQALEWIPRIQENERGEYERIARADGLREFQINERDAQGKVIRAQGRDEYFPVYFVEPYAGNEKALGFDLASNGTRRAALEKARDTGKLVVSGRITLVQETGNQFAVLAFRPVYRKNFPINTIELRRKYLMGFILGVFRVGDIIEQGILSRIKPGGIDIYVYDRSASGENEFLYFHPSRLRQETISPESKELIVSGVHRSVTVPVGDREWSILYKPIAGIHPETTWVPLSSFLVGILFTAILTIYLIAGIGREKRISGLVDQRTSELIQNRERFQALADNLPEFISMKDRGGRFIFINKRFEEWTGMKSENVVNKTVHDIYPAEQAESFAKQDRYAIENDIVVSREIDLAYPDGNTRTVTSTRFPVKSAAGEVMGLGTINIDLSERKKVEEALSIAKNEADAANLAKSEFLSSMSHELRTPLNAILGFGQMLEYNPNEPLTDGQKGCVEHITKGGQHLLDLINEVLDLSRIESGKLELSIENIFPSEILDDCLPLIGAMAEDRDIKITSGTIEEGVVRADYTRLKQVLLNLMSNAVKYNRDGGVVKLEGKSTGSGMYRISVADTGYGIAEKNHSELFQPFTRFSAEESEIEGTGIGLTITKRLIEAMGGRIEFESEQDKGSTFWIELPLTMEKYESPAVETGDDGPVEVTISTPKAKILYVEDNPANIHLMEMVLKRLENIELLVAHNAEIGILTAKMENPDVILMDINLPGMNGIEALKELRQNIQTREIPVIAISAAAMPRDIENGMKAGFYNYLTKPFKIPALLKSIEEVLEKK